MRLWLRRTILPPTKRRIFRRFKHDNRTKTGYIAEFLQWLFFGHLAVRANRRNTFSSMRETLLA